MPNKHHKTLLILSVLTIASLVLALLSGSSGLPTLSSALSQDILWSLRLPRAINAFTIGGLLALAGCQMQVLLRNPLADPYILGVSGGASAATLVGLLLGFSGGLLSLSGWCGALFTIFIVFRLAHGAGNWQPTRLLLTGVVTAMGWSALVSLILTLTPGRDLGGMLYWLLGEIPDRAIAWNAIIILALCTLASLLYARDLNLLAHGRLRANSLGINIKHVTLGLYLLSALLTATAVNIAGNIGFVGLMVPHLIRLLIGSDHRRLIPAAVLLGGNLLLLADTIARSAFAPLELPVGIITALLGIPLFLWLMQRGYEPCRN